MKFTEDANQVDSIKSYEEVLNLDSRSLELQVYHKIHISDLVQTISANLTFG